MDTIPLTEDDVQLIADAKQFLKEHYKPGRHTVSAAIRTSSGKTYTAINLCTPSGKVDEHAEPIAIANAIMDGENRFDTCVAIMNDSNRGIDMDIVSACGPCREFIRNFAPDTMIIIPTTSGPVKASISGLLPARPITDA